jgi:hypothetical protein
VDTRDPSAVVTLHAKHIRDCGGDRFCPVAPLAVSNYSVPASAYRGWNEVCVKRG